MMAQPIITRTGTARPPIPSDYPMSASDLPPTPPQTTREGARLEITPVSTLEIPRPEIAISTAISPPSSRSGGPARELGREI